MISQAIKISLNLCGTATYFLHFCHILKPYFAFVARLRKEASSFWVKSSICLVIKLHVFSGTGHQTQNISILMTKRSCSSICLVIKLYVFSGTGHQTQNISILMTKHPYSCICLVIKLHVFSGTGHQTQIISILMTKQNLSQILPSFFMHFIDVKEVKCYTYFIFMQIGVSLQMRWKCVVTALEMRWKCTVVVLRRVKR